MSKDTERKRHLVSNFTRDIAIAVLLFSIGMLSLKGYKYIEAYKFDESIRKESFKSVEMPGRLPPAYPIANVARMSYPDGPTIESLYAQLSSNKDFRFFIYIPGALAYPVVQTIDNEYYLKNNSNKQRNESGAIFMDFRNNAEKLNGNVILYGHSMKDGTKFGSLYKFENQDYYEKNSMIYTYSINEVVAWKIFSSYKTDISDNYIETNFSSKSQYFNFIKNFQQKSLIKSDVVLSEDDDILTLSTCYDTSFTTTRRFVVHAKKISSTPIQ